MKILLVHNTYRDPGGEDVVFRQEAELLTRFGHTVLTYVRNNHEIGERPGAHLLSFGKRLIWAKDTWRDITGILYR